MPRGSRTKPLVIVLDLEHVEDLFAAPDVSPMSPNYRMHSYTSGVEYASSVIGARRHRGDVCLEIRLAEISVSDDVGPLIDQVRGGVHRWAESQRSHRERSIAGRRRFGYSTLAVGVILLFALITASRSVNAGNSFSLSWIVAQGLTIGAWLALWYPLEHFIFGLWEQREGARTFAILAGATVKITPQVE
jgi:hypothetical protein